MNNENTIISYNLLLIWLSEGWGSQSNEVCYDIQLVASFFKFFFVINLAIAS